MSLKVEVTQSPGLHELLDTDQPPASLTHLESSLDDFLGSAGVQGSPMEKSVNERSAAAARSTGEGLGWWQALKKWWNEEDHRVVATEQHEIELAAYWLTLPAVKGASVSLSSSRTSSKEASAALTIAGIGGGPSFQLTLKEEVSFEGKAPERALLTAPATFEKVEVYREGQLVGTYARLKSIDEGNFTWTRREEKPPESASLGAPLQTKGFKLKGASGPSTQEVSISKGTTWEIGADLKVWGIGVKLGGKITYEQEVDYANKLPGGHDYEAKNYRNFPAFLWTATT